MSVLLLHVDAFTEAAFSGNPAAVCLLPPPSSDEWKQKLAAELNLSETSFVERLPQPSTDDSSIKVFASKRTTMPSPNLFKLRWFTPKAEVPLCGHATLASAHALWEENIVSRDSEITFETRSGHLRASWSPNGITLDFPAITAQVRQLHVGLESAIGARVVHFAESATKLLVELESEEDVRQVKPNFNILGGLPKEGVIITARASNPKGSKPGDPDYFDFVSRFFAPKLGVPEDPVTGSSHSVLGPWWQAKLGKNEFHARQLSERGGSLIVRVEKFADETRVFLTGHAVTIARGELKALPREKAAFTQANAEQNQAGLRLA